MTDRKITRITAENFMRLKAVDISPDGNIIYITGANGEGKSSVLNAICAALNWREAAGSIPEPIHKGQNRASVSVDLGDMVVTRTWTPSGTQLKVESVDGAVYKSPQAMLDKFFNRIGFDPLEFTRMQPRDQRTTLMDLLRIDFSELDHSRAELLKQKNIADSTITSLNQQLTEIPEVPEDIPDEEVSAIDLMKQIQAAQTAVMIADHKFEELSRTTNRLNDVIAQIESLKDEQKTLEEHQIAINNEIAGIIVPDLAPLQEQLSNIETINKQVRIRQQRSGIIERLHLVQNSLEDLSSNISCIDQDKKDALESAKFPISGLSFDESGVMYQGIPLKQASSAEQIRVSLAVGIAMNPSLKFLIIRDGSLLDSKGRKLIADMAAEHDIQVFIEAVDESGKVGFVISDGMVQESITKGQQVIA